MPFIDHHDYSESTPALQEVLLDMGHSLVPRIEMLKQWQAEHAHWRIEARRAYEEAGMIPQTAEDWALARLEFEWESYSAAYLEDWPLAPEARKALAYWEEGLEMLHDSNHVLDASEMTSR